MVTRSNSNGKRKRDETLSPIEAKELRDIIESQKGAIEDETQLSSAYKRINNVHRDTINIMEQNNKTLSQTIENSERSMALTQEELSNAMRTADLVRVELDNLRFIMATGKNPSDENPVCPTSNSSFMPTDNVVVFQGSCSCNVMMKMSSSRAQIEEFYVNKKVKCIKCFALCDKISFSSVLEFNTVVSWSKLQTLTGCGDFVSVSAQNSLLENKKIDDTKMTQKTTTKKNVDKATQTNAVYVS